MRAKQAAQIMHVRSHPGREVRIALEPGLVATPLRSDNPVALLPGRQSPLNQPELPAATRRQAFVMRHHDKSRAMLARQLQHQLKHAIGGGAVQIAGGLVSQYARGLRYQGTRNRHTLALAA